MDTSPQNREKAIYVTPSIPDRYGIGIQQRAYRNLNLLTEEYDVDVIIVADKEEPLNLDDLNINSVSWLAARFYTDIPRVLGNIPGCYVTWRITSLLAFPLHVRRNTKELQQVLNMFAKTQYAYGLFFRISTAWVRDFLVKKLNCTFGYAAIDFDDIESKAKTRSLQTTREKRGFQKYLSELVETRLAGRKERWCLRAFNSVWVCSDVDQRELKALPNVGAHLEVMPNTIYIAEQLPRSKGKKSILILGAMSYFPNIDAAQFFCCEVLPSLKMKLNAEVQLFIVGSSPEAEVLQLGEIDGVTVTGRVESVKEYYEKADIIIVPIRFGGGTRIKILEAMSLGRIVISTTIGAEGIDARNGEEIIIADSANEYIEVCHKYLLRPELRYIVEANARKFVESKFGFGLAKSIFSAMPKH